MPAPADNLMPYIKMKRAALPQTGKPTYRKTGRSTCRKTGKPAAEFQYKTHNVTRPATPVADRRRYFRTEAPASGFVKRPNNYTDQRLYMRPTFQP